jgi:hypothetical protein
MMKSSSSIRALYLLCAVCFSAVTIPAAVPSAPKVSICANGVAEAKVFRGMPLLVSVSLVHPLFSSADAQPILISSALGAWTNAIHIEIVDATGTAQQWPFNTRIAPGPTITLDHSKYARFDQWLTPEQTLNLPTGVYTLSVKLDTTAPIAAAAWKGVVEPAPAAFEILNEPATLTEEEAEEKYAQLAEYELFQKNGAKALQHIDQLLTAFPTNLGGMKIKATALNALGRTAEAHALSTQALETYYAQNKVAQEPPISLLTLQNELEQTLLKPILRLNSAPNQAPTVDWLAHPSLTYRVESSTDFQLWSTFSTTFNIASDRYSLTLPTAGDHKFFRLSIGNAPVIAP